MKITANTPKSILLTIISCLFINAATAQNQVVSASPETPKTQVQEMAKPAPIMPGSLSPNANQGPSREDMEQRKKMGELNKEIQVAEKAGNGATPEIVVKKEELKKLQEQMKTKMMAENEKRRKENQEVAAKNNEANQKIISLNKEIKDAEAAGKGEAPEIVAKKAELKKLQDEKDANMKADRERMQKERPQMSPEDMEANKKMGQLSQEIRDAEKDGRGETPEVIAKKAELKKMQEARMAKMKAEREKPKGEQEKVAAPADKSKGAAIENKKVEPAKK